MPEQIPENSLPLNQLAKQGLKMLKVVPDSSDLYLLQLIRWCLYYGKVQLQGPVQARSTIKELLEEFHTWSMKNIMQVFQEDSDGNPVEIYPSGAVDPEGLVMAALEQLDGRLTEALPDYPTAFRVED